MAKIDNDFQGEDEPNIRYKFSISYNATKGNKRTHSDFKDLSKSYDDCYIATIRALLDTYEQSWNFDNINMQLAMLTDRVVALETMFENIAEQSTQEEQKKEKKGLRTFADKREE